MNIANAADHEDPHALDTRAYNVELLQQSFLVHAVVDLLQFVDSTIYVYDINLSNSLKDGGCYLCKLSTS